MNATNPLCVAVDAFGLIVRVRHGVIRVAFDSICSEQEQVEQGVEELMASG